MIPQLLLTHFERIVDAPDATPRLRQFILELAVRGKLVDQDATEEPASELLKRIREEKVRLVRAGRIKAVKPSAVGDSCEGPYTIPANWSWVPVGETVNSHVGGGTPSKNNSSYWNGDICWASVKDVGKAKFIDGTVDRITEAGLAASSSNLVPPGNLIVVTRMGLGKLSINRIAIAINQDLRALTLSSLANIDYHYIFFKTYGFSGTGLTVKGIKVEELLKIAFPLPPVAEQHRIVAKVDELIGLCDRLEAQRGERESRRNGLVAASLARLNRPADESTAESFPEDVRFYLNHLPRITTRAEHISVLRETILNLAVRGQLVPQDLNDEPVSELLARVRSAQQQLMKSGKIPRQKSLTSDHTARVAFSLPRNWQGANFGSLCNLVTSGSRGWAEYYSKSGPKFIRAQNIRFGRLRLDDLACVSLPEKAEGTRTQVSRSDLLVVITGAGVTNPALVDCELGEAYVSQHVALIKPTETKMSPWLLLCLMAHSAARTQLLEKAYGAGKPGLNLDNIRFLTIPIAPLGEQHRIVAKVHQLMALCDRLEVQLSVAEANGRNMLEAALDMVLKNHTELNAATHNTSSCAIGTRG